jgi:hypothetical protein
MTPSPRTNGGLGCHCENIPSKLSEIVQCLELGFGLATFSLVRGWDNGGHGTELRKLHSDDSPRSVHAR